MDFKLTDEQELIVGSMRELMERENWEPYFAECDDKHEYPERFTKALAEIGGDSIMLPEEQGGIDGGWTTQLAAWLELGRLGAPTYAFWHLANWAPALRDGTPEQIEKVMAYKGTGKQVWNTGCMTEPGAGSSLTNITTTYERRNGKVYLNGHKAYQTSSKLSPYMLILARDKDNMDVFTEWFLDMSKPGITLEPLSKLGLRMDSCCELYMDEVELEESDMFGKEGNGFINGINDFEFERFLMASTHLGPAMCAYEDALKYANQREMGGQVIGRYELIQYYICKMLIDITNMKNMLFEVAWKHDNGVMGKGDCSMCKYYCVNTSFEVVDYAMQILGGLSVTGDHRVSRFWRDLRVDRIAGGTDEMMLLTAARQALKQYR